MPNDAILLVLGDIARASDSPMRLTQPKGTIRVCDRDLPAPKVASSLGST